MDSLSGPQWAYIEEMGQSTEQHGLQRSIGRVAGLLLISGSMLSQENIMNLLGLSRTSTSVALRWLERFGFVHQVCVTGDRRRYYQVRQDVADWMVRVSVRHIEDDLRLMSMAESVAEEGARERVGEAREMLEFLNGRIQKALAEWERREKVIR